MPTSRGNPDDIVRALADPERMAIAGVLARADRTADELASTLELEPRRAFGWVVDGSGLDGGALFSGTATRWVFA